MLDTPHLRTLVKVCSFHQAMRQVMRLFVVLEINAHDLRRVGLVELFFSGCHLDETHLAYRMRIYQVLSDEER